MFFRDLYIIYIDNVEFNVIDANHVYTVYIINVVYMVILAKLFGD